MCSHARDHNQVQRRSMQRGLSYRRDGQTDGRTDGFSALYSRYILLYIYIYIYIYIVGMAILYTHKLILMLYTHSLSSIALSYFTIYFADDGF